MCSNILVFDTILSKSAKTESILGSVEMGLTMKKFIKILNVFLTLLIVGQSSYLFAVTMDQAMPSTTLPYIVYVLSGGLIGLVIYSVYQTLTQKVKY